MNENKYINGKIYKIISSETENIYIGSTILPLDKRYRTHKNTNNTCSSNEIIKLGGSKIELIENYECETKGELKMREQHFIDMYREICINKNDTILTEEKKKEKAKKRGEIFRKNNKEHFKNYYKENKEKMDERAKKYREKQKGIIQTCECGKDIQQRNMAVHIKTLVHMRKLNISA
jgi:hypothetical protein